MSQLVRPIRYAFSRGLALVPYLFALITAACSSLPPYTLSPLPPGAVQLPFETLSLAQHGWGSHDDPSNPTIGVIGASDDVDRWQGQVSPLLFASLQAVDYANNLVVLVNRGESQCLPPEPSAILQIVRLGQHVQVFANFPEYSLSGGSHPCPAILVYPHHIVIVPKQGIWRDTFTFDLMVGPQAVATVEHWIP